MSMHSTPTRKLSELNGEEILEVLKTMPQFIIGTLNPVGRSGWLDSPSGLINLLNGCFIKQVFNTKPAGLFRKGEMSIARALDLIWQDSASDSPAHRFRVTGDTLSHFVVVMALQAKTLNPDYTLPVALP